MLPYIVITSQIIINKEYFNLELKCFLDNKRINGPKKASKTKRFPPITLIIDENGKCKIKQDRLG